MQYYFKHFRFSIIFIKNYLNQKNKLSINNLNLKLLEKNKPIIKVRKYKFY